MTNDDTDRSLAEKYNLPDSPDHGRNTEVEGPKGPTIAHNCANRNTDRPLLGPAEGCCIHPSQNQTAQDDLTVDELVQAFRELADDWHDNAEVYLDSDVDSERAMALQEWRCAQQVEALLDRYTKPDVEQTNGTVQDVPYECPACGRDTIDEHQTHVECSWCGWTAEYEQSVDEQHD